MERCPKCQAKCEQFEPGVTIATLAESLLLHLRGFRIGSVGRVVSSFQPRFRCMTCILFVLVSMKSWYCVRKSGKGDA